MRTRGGDRKGGSDAAADPEPSSENTLLSAGRLRRMSQRKGREESGEQDEDEKNEKGEDEKNERDGTPEELLPRCAETIVEGLLEGLRSTAPDKAELVDQIDQKTLIEGALQPLSKSAGQVTTNQIAAQLVAQLKALAPQVAPLVEGVLAKLKEPAHLTDEPIYALDEAAVKRLKTAHLGTKAAFERTREDEPQKNPEAAKEAEWSGVDEYVASRVGAVEPIIQSLQKGDEVLVTNLSRDAAIATATNQGGDKPQPVTRVTDVHLPARATTKARRPMLSVPGFSDAISILELGSGEKAQRRLVVSGVPGETLAVHFQMMLARSAPEGVGVHALSSMPTAAKNYGGLSSFFSEHAGALGDAETIVFGYAQGFDNPEYSGGKLQPAGDVPAGKSGWSAKLYLVEGGGKIAVLASGGSLHGENLGENVRELLAANPIVRRVLVAGSGGALTAAPGAPGDSAEYALQFPSKIRGRDRKKEVPNQLAGDNDEGVHTSVRSPLEETPNQLGASKANGVTTLDMEFGVLAEIVGQPLDLRLKWRKVNQSLQRLMDESPDHKELFAKLKDEAKTKDKDPEGADFGVGILVTDYPMEKNPGVNLTRQSQEKKEKAIHEFVQRVLQAIESARK
jgi:hypothetical protein